jgi:serine/threonine protein kinase
MAHRLAPFGMVGFSTADCRGDGERCCQGSGDTLEIVLRGERRARLDARSLDQAAALLEPVAQALAFAHTKGMCHRNVKPGSILVLRDPGGQDRTSRLLGFGMASVAGSFAPAYGAPEQFSQCYGVPGPWTDVFALALILVELVAGRAPMGEGVADELRRVAVDPTRRPTPRALQVLLPDAVEMVFASGLAIFPAERFQMVGAFWRALREAMSASGSVLASARAEQTDAAGHPCP